MSGLSFQARKIKKNMSGPDRCTDGVTLHKQGVGASVHTARAVRTEISKEEVSTANVHNVSTLTLLRIRAQNLRSSYKRLWRSHVDFDKVPSLYESKEGNDDNDPRINELRGYVAQRVRVVEDLRAKVRA